MTIIGLSAALFGNSDTEKFDIMQLLIERKKEVVQGGVSFISLGTTHKMDGVQLVFQNPELPNGCEVTSLAMLLTAAGADVDNTTLWYDGYLESQGFSFSGGIRQGPDPEIAYAGDAASSSGGWYCLEQPILRAGNAWLRAKHSAREMLSLTGMYQTELDEYAQREIAVVAWVTRDYEAPKYNQAFGWALPSGEWYTPYNNLHCVVVTGLSGNSYLIADPINGWQTVEKEQFWYSFDAMGRLAVTVQ